MFDQILLVAAAVFGLAVVATLTSAFFTVELDEAEQHRTGRVVEFDDTEKMFTNPSDPRTEAYVTGKFG